MSANLTKLGLLVARVVLLATTVTAVIILTWHGVHRPYLLEKTRGTDLLLAEARTALQQSEAANNRLADENVRLSQKADAIRNRLGDVLKGYVIIQDRLDSIDSRLYRMERLPGVLGNGEQP